MNSEERVWAALNIEPVDRVPIHTVVFEEKICAEVLGKPSRNALDVVDELEKLYPDDLVEQVNSVMTELETNLLWRMVETTAIMGFDTCGVGYVPFKYETRERMSDAYGRKYKVVNLDGNIMTYYYDGMIKNQEDWENFPKPDVKEICKRAKKLYRTILRRSKKLENKHFVVIAQDNFASVFPTVWQGMGMIAFAKALKKNPKMIKERFEMTTEIAIELFKTYAECGAKVFLEGADIADRIGPLVNPKYIDKYVLPCMKQVTEVIHDLGGKIIFHSDGNILPILDFIVESGFDGIHCLEPPHVDIEVVKKKVGDKLCLLGNIDTTHILVDGTKKEVEDAVKHAIKILGPGGGFMVSPSNTHPAMNYQQIKWMVEATKQYGVYPIKL